MRYAYWLIEMSEDLIETHENYVILEISLLAIFVTLINLSVFQTMITRPFFAVKVMHILYASY